MWKLLVAVAIIMNLGEAQRSSYAPRPGSNSKLLPRFRKNETAAGLGIRGGQEDSETNSSTSLPSELQGTLEDHRFVHRVSQWPEDRQPFWFKNRYAISSMRDRNIDGGIADQQNVENVRSRPKFQSPFQGPGKDVGRERGRGNSIVQFSSNENFFNEDFTNNPVFSYRPRTH